VVVASALPFRATAIPFATLAPYWPVIANLSPGLRFFETPLCR
jgi:hypothetical protein